jgi:hypothetical protein
MCPVATEQVNDMTDLNRIVDGLMKSGVLGGLAGGVAGGALAGMFGGKGAKKLGKTALQAPALCPGARCNCLLCVHQAVPPCVRFSSRQMYQPIG